MHTLIKGLVTGAALVLATQAVAQVTFYEGEGFHGQAFTADRPIADFDPYGFNDRASSAVVDRGTWQVCEDARFEGHCVILRPGHYASLGGMGMNRRISSVRPVEENARYEQQYAPQPPATVAYEYQKRPDERLYEANVRSVHAVVGPPEQRCWVERQQVVEENRGANVPGAIIGGIIGGVLGHQVGSGRGNDVATAAGAVGGAAIGANAGRGGTTAYDRDVQRCENVPRSAQPDYWDVTYEFRGVEHRVQLTAPPGPTITVNGEGEPRG
jgi:uncharacterized protein YcfJ